MQISVKSKIFNTAIYSCYYGDVISATFRPIRYGNIDSYFITNNQKIADIAIKFGWTVIIDELPVTSCSITNAFYSKKVKCKPNIFLPLLKYHYLIYVDDKVEINPNLVYNNGIDCVKSGASICLREHPTLKSNIWCEFALAILQPRYRVNKDVLWKYINNKLKEGYKEDHILYWTSVIFRDMKNPDTIKINEMWYDEVEKCGIECQVSFFFTSQKFDSVGILPSTVKVENIFLSKLLKKLLFYYECYFKK